MKRLNEISDIIMGQSPASSTYNTIGEGVPFFQGNADFGIEHPNVRVYCSLPTKMSEKGDVLISVRAPIGAVNIANQTCCIGRGLAAVRPLEGKSQTRYLYHLLIANKEVLESKGTGSTFKAITGKVLNDVHVPSYNMEQQKEIARLLDTVVAAITKRRKQIDFYNDLVKSQFIEMFGDIVRNERGWRSERMEQIAPAEPYRGHIASFDGKYWLLNLDMVEAQTGEIISKVMVDTAEIGNSTTTFGSENVLYSKLRPYLNKVVIPTESGYATSELIPLKPNSEKLNKYYFASALRSDAFVGYIQEQVAGAKMPRVSMGVFRTFFFPCPPIELQNKFARFVEQTDKSKIPYEMEVAA